VSELSGKRVLVVDDEVDICRLVAFELTECQVDMALSFAEAVARFEAARYDVVILDIMGVDGYTLLDRMAARAPCIILTGRALSREDLRRAVTGRAVLFLPKDELGRLERYVAKAVGAREPLWSWLLERLDFTRWLGPSFRPSDLDLEPPEGPA
jgi:CheY-like chemotaxis protein